MIKSFKSKALKNLWDRNDESGVGQSATRVRRLLDILNAADSPTDMNLPGLYFHRLNGVPVRYSARVTANLRLTFEWDSPDAWRVDLEEYH